MSGEEGAQLQPLGGVCNFSKGYLMIVLIYEIGAWGTDEASLYNYKALLSLASLWEWLSEELYVVKNIDCLFFLKLVSQSLFRKFIRFDHSSNIYITDPCMEVEIQAPFNKYYSIFSPRSTLVQNL